MGIVYKADQLNMERARQFLTTSGNTYKVLDVKKLDGSVYTVSAKRTASLYQKSSVPFKVDQQVDLSLHTIKYHVDGQLCEERIASLMYIDPVSDIELTTSGGVKFMALARYSIWAWCGWTFIMLILACIVTTLDTCFGVMVVVCFLALFFYTVWQAEQLRKLRAVWKKTARDADETNIKDYLNK